MPAESSSPQSYQARVQAERRAQRVLDSVCGLMVTEPGTLPLSLQERDLSTQIRSALREADKNGWEFGKVPCCVLRDVYDRLTNADTSQRHSLLGAAHIGNTYGANKKSNDDPDEDEEIV